MSLTIDIKNNTFKLSHYSNDQYKKTCVIEVFKLNGVNHPVKVGSLSVIIESTYIVAHDSFVDANFRRMGLATKMYNYAESVLNKKIIPYEQHSGQKSSFDAVQFWKKRTGIILQDRHVIYED